MAIGTFKGLIRVINTIYENVFLYAKRVTDDDGQVVNLTAVSTFMDTLTGELLALLPSGTKAGKLYVEQPNDGTADFTVVRNSTATYVDNNGVIRAVIIDEPRIESGALLVEPQSTNLLEYSDDFNNALWVKLKVSLTSDENKTPDLNIGQYLFTEDLTTGYHNVQNSISTTLGLTYTASVYLKYIDRQYVNLSFFNSGGGSRYASASFDIQNGIVSDTKSLEAGYSVISATITHIIDGWYRCSIVVTNGSVFGANTFSFASSDTGLVSTYGLNSFLGTGKKYYAWGAQLEQIATPTSYIKTIGSSVTRLADVITVTPPVGTTSITETIDGVEQTPITVIPVTYTVPEGNINKIIME